MISLTPAVTANRSPHQHSLHQLTLHPPSLSTIPFLPLSSPCRSLSFSRSLSRSRSRSLSAADAPEAWLLPPWCACDECDPTAVLPAERLPPERAEEREGNFVGLPVSKPLTNPLAPPFPPSSEAPFCPARSISCTSVHSAKLIKSRHSNIRKTESVEIAANLSPNSGGENSISRIVPRGSVRVALRLNLVVESCVEWERGWVEMERERIGG